MQIISWICQGVKTLSLILKVIAIYLYRGSVADTRTSNSKWQRRKHKNIDLIAIQSIFQ